MGSRTMGQRCTGKRILVGHDARLSQDIFDSRHLAQASLGVPGLFDAQRFTDGRSPDPGRLLQVSAIACGLFGGLSDGQASPAGHLGAGRRLVGLVGGSGLLADHQSVFSFLDVDGFVVGKP